jgi:hypothetical protein
MLFWFFLFCFFDKGNIVVSRVLCTSKKQLIKSLRIILDEGGEGVILRRPGSKYEHGRSNHLFKLKVFLYYFTLAILASFFFSFFYIYSCKYFLLIRPREGIKKHL